MLTTRTYRTSHTLPARLKIEAWRTHRDPGRSLITLGLLAAGGLLLALGIGRATWQPGPRDERATPTRDIDSPDGTFPAASAGESSAIVTEPISETEKSETASRALTSLASILVWGTWALMLLSSLALVARYGSNFPNIADDWWMLRYQLGKYPITLSWLWEPWNEHRMPLPKLVNIALFRLAGGDFRAGMYFNALALGAIAFAMIRAARHLRGETSTADAFFPLVLLNFGHSVNMLMHAVLNFMVSSLVACAMLILILRTDQMTAPRTTFWVGICLLILLMCGVTGLVFVPALAIWLCYVSFLQWSSRAAASKRHGLVLLVLVSLALLGALGIGAGTEREEWARPADPGKKMLAVAAQFLTLSLGPAYCSSWPFSGAGLLILALLTSVFLVIVGLRHRGEWVRVLGLLCFMASMAILALAVGWGRAGIVSENDLLGCGNAWQLRRYIGLAVPLLCCVYCAWALMRSSLSRLVQFGMLIVALAMAPSNTTLGLDLAKQTRKTFEAGERDIKEGLSPYEIIARNRGCFILADTMTDFPIMELMQEMRQAGIGSFRHLQANPPFRRIVLPLTPSATANIQMEPEAGKGHVTGPGGYLTFSLPRATYVSLIRFRCAHSDPASGAKIQWKTSAESGFSTELHDSAFYKKNTIISVCIAGTIDRFRIYPGDRPCDFHISDLELLVPTTTHEPSR